MTNSFKNLGLSDACVKQLEAIGFVEPTHIQQQAIPQLLQGKDMVGQSQTGTGKTAAFSLPMIELIDIESSAVQALILTPTRELAQQVSQAIQDFRGNRRFFVLTVCGGQSIEKQIRSLQRGVQVVVGTPGRVIDLLERKVLNLDNLRIAVLDEADEMLSMGFIDDVKKILKCSSPERQTACFSATMPREIRELIEQFLKDPVTVTVSQPKAAPARIEQRIYMMPRGWRKVKALLPILEIEEPESAIIFVRTKKTASDLTIKLQEAGHSVDEYHGNLSQGQRERLVQRFRGGKIKMVVATDIAARGLDVEHLSHVINYDLPDNTETYIHRIGRTGRAGKEGTAISLVNYADRRLLKSIERRLRQRLDNSKIPSRAEVEAKRVAKLQAQVLDSLAGERMASFLPIVKELMTEYDAQAIAAATLQMVFDKNSPDWMKTDWDVPQGNGVPKPVLKGKYTKRNNYSARNSGRRSRQSTMSR
ncbi:MAG: DEAD/DEAH box helicase [Cyanobacteria bacterium J083]|nr:MAG: DEAD/DEAH box helicase [Cyanobacteria bacterium J083]